LIIAIKKYLFTILTKFSLAKNIHLFTGLAYHTTTKPYKTYTYPPTYQQLWISWWG